MDARFPQFQSDNPHRSIAWRWERACHLVNHGGTLSPRQDDPATRTAARFLRAWHRCRDQARLAEKWRTLCAAHRLAVTDGRQRWELRARILARQSDAEIAARCALTAETVQWFEALFFNTRDRLGAVDWITSRCFGLGIRFGVRPGDLETLWAVFAYHGGPLVLDVVRAVSVDADQPGWPWTAAANPGGEDRLQRSARLAIAALMIPVEAPSGQLAAVVGSVHRLDKRPRTTRKAVVQVDTAAFEALAAALPHLNPESVLHSAVA
jgi:hypothetical protein